MKVKFEAVASVGVLLKIYAGRGKGSKVKTVKLFATFAALGLHHMYNYNSVLWLTAMSMIFTCVALLL
jgi:hypothetical protein